MADKDDQQHCPRVVIEMTDLGRTVWTGYFAEAERYRDAVASMGLVRTIDQNGGQTLRAIGAQRLVLAFGPTTTARTSCVP